MQDVFSRIFMVLESFGAVSVFGCSSLASPQAAGVISVSNETLSQLLPRYQSRILAMSTCYTLTLTHHETRYEDPSGTNIL